MSKGTSYSAEIAMFLQINGTRLNIAGCLDNTCILRDLTELPPCNAELVISVDGYEKRERIHLPNGVSRDRKDVEIRILT
jgi:hypothetical protein